MRGFKTRIPKRAHHKACSKNLKTRGASERTVFANREAARNLAANRAAIANRTSTYQGFFAGDFVDLPRFYDHSYLHYLNERAGSFGLPPIFDDTNPVSENNGEVFLSKYFEEQLVRNQTVGQDKKTSMCPCPTCIADVSKITQIRLFAPEENNDGNDNSNGMLNSPLVPAAPPIFFSHHHRQRLALFLPSHLQNWRLVGYRGRMIAATSTGLANTIAQRMLSIFAERTPVCKSWASHHMIRLVLSDVIRRVSPLDYSNLLIILVM